MLIRQFCGRHIATTRERYGCAIVPGMTRVPEDLPSAGEFEAPGRVVL
jgi:hypothetical protein